MWAVLGLLTAVLIALMMLLQERLKVEGFSLALWCKVACVLTTAPFVAYFGLPHDPRFYAWIFPQASLYVVADVILFRALPVIGAGAASRLLPATVVTSFLLWFAVSPSDLHVYIDRPLMGFLLALVLCGAAFFASHLRKCAVSMDAVKRLWFVMLANTLSPVLCKITTGYATKEQGAFGFTFSEALMMISMWLIWLAVAKPVPLRDLLSKGTVVKSLSVGMLTATMVCVIVASYYFIDNPGYVCALQLLYAVIVMAAHKWMGKKDESDVYAGLGMVACAVLLVILRSRME